LRNVPLDARPIHFDSRGAASPDRSIKHVKFYFIKT